MQLKILGRNMSPAKILEDVSPPPAYTVDEAAKEKSEQGPGEPEKEVTHYGTNPFDHAPKNLRKDRGFTLNDPDSFPFQFPLLTLSVFVHL
jgi:hypothetical protein